MKVLIVVDMQKDFIDGSLGTKEAEAIVDNVEKKIAAFDGKVFFTKDTHFEDYMETFEGKNLPVEHCIKGTDGWEICDKLLPYADTVLEKNTFGYLNWKEILPAYEEIDSIELCGLCTDICVISNALILRAIYPGKEIIVDPGCCAGVTPEKHSAALEVMRSCQITV